MSVALRPLVEADGPHVLAWRNAPEVARWMYSDHAIGAVEHARWLQGALSLPDRRYWIIELEGEGVGLANLARIDAAASRCEWAFYLASPAVRGRGVGAAVEYLVLRHVFEALTLNKLWCEVLAENVGVVRLHERFGFTREALLRDHVRKAGVFCDVVGLGLLAREWPAVKTAAEMRLQAHFDLAGLRLTTA